MMDNIIASDQLTILYKPNTSYIIYTLHSKTKGIKHARFSFFFFGNVKLWSFINVNQPNKCGEIPSIHTSKFDMRLPYLARLWATELSFLLVWEESNLSKFWESAFTSSINRPSGAKECTSNFKALINTSELVNWLLNVAMKNNWDNYPLLVDIWLV